MPTREPLDWHPQAEAAIGLFLANGFIVRINAFHKSLVATKPGFVRSWSEFEGSFNEPFRSYVAGEFARRQTPT